MIRGDRAVRVLQSVKGPSATTNPYVVQLVRSLPAGVRVAYFSWRRGLLGRFDVLHVHWPEVMLRREGRLARIAAGVRFALLMLRVTVTRKPLVRTLHNVGTHEQGNRVERALLRWCDRRTAFWILLNPYSTPPRPGPCQVIPHGHYRDWFAAHPRADRVPGRLVSVGLIRPYKGTDRLIAAFSQVPDPALSLVVAGRPTTDGLRALVAAAAADDSRVTAHLRHVDDATLVREMSAAQVVVLPYRGMHNSGALLLALSLDRPVLVPRTATTLELAAEVGAGWVHTYDGELGPQHLVAAVAGTADLPPKGPDLSAREWPPAGAAHEQVYRRVIRRRP